MKNNTTRTLAIVVLMLTAATLVVGAITAPSTQSTAFAYSKNKKGGGEENSRNGNTVTIEECKNRCVAQTPVTPAQGNPGPKPVITQGSLAVSGTGVLTGQLTVTQQGTVYNVQISGSATGVTSQTCTNIHSDKQRTVSSGQFAASGTTLVNGGGAVNSGNSFSIQLSPTFAFIHERCNSE